MDTLPPSEPLSPGVRNPAYCPSLVLGNHLSALLWRAGVSKLPREGGSRKFLGGGESVPGCGILGRPTCRQHGVLCSRDSSVRNYLCVRVCRRAIFGEIAFPSLKTFILQKTLFLHGPLLLGLSCTHDFNWSLNVRVFDHLQMSISSHHPSPEPQNHVCNCLLKKLLFFPPKALKHSKSRKSSSFPKCENVWGTGIFNFRFITCTQVYAQLCTQRMHKTCIHSETRICNFSPVASGFVN